MKFLIAKKRISRYLLATAIAFIAFTSQTTFAAVAIKFQPGAADACGLNVNRMTGSTSFANLDQYEDVASFEWAVVNAAPAATTGLPDDRHIFFDVNSSSNTLPAGATFATAFTMRLLSIDGAGGVKQYGVDDAAASIYADNARSILNVAVMRYPTHVFVQANLQGSLRAARGFGSYPAFDLVKSNPLFSQAQFKMFFDADGDLATTGDQTLIAKFGMTSAPDALSSMAGTVAVNVETAAIIVNWDSALPGVFADQSGHELATGAVDTVDQFLRGVSVAAQPTSQVEFDFRFECATSGACTVVAGNTLRFRLHMQSGQNTMTSIPSSTKTPAVLCPNKPEQKDLGNAVCFPFAFCPFPYFGILVLVLIAIAVVVVVVVVVKKVNQQQRSQ